jgi:protein-S-isoprenylcysteine O-methyltransferase Ste14
MLARSAAARRLGAWLVALQLSLIVALGACAAPAFLEGAAPLWSWGALVAGCALGLWALAFNRPGNFNVQPVPRIGGVLVASGPYRWIRHPMYSAVLLGGVAAGGAISAGASARAWVAVAALAVVLAVKAALEEEWMAQTHPGYAEYRKRTWRFVPGIY